MPQKIWALGEEVLATDFNTYVQTQVVARFATVAARDAAWPAVTAGVGAVCTTTDTGIMWTVVPINSVPTWINTSSARGVVAQNIVTSDQGSIGTPATLAYFDTVFTPRANRRYKVTACVHLSITAASSWFLDIVDDPAGNAYRMFDYSGAPGSARMTNVLLLPQIAFTFPVDVAHTLHLRATRYAGTGLLNSFATGGLAAFILIEDIGSY